MKRSARTLTTYFAKVLLIVLAGTVCALPARDATTPDYTIEAIRFGTLTKFPVSRLIPNTTGDETVEAALVIWLVRGGGHNILFDSGFHRERWFESFPVSDYIRPDEAVRQAGVAPGEVTDIIISHSHWDHIGGIDLFPNATIWIQAEEYAYYTGAAWQQRGRRGGIDREDILHLVDRNTRGQVRLVAGDDVEILPGIRAYTGGKHTYASQYLRVEGTPPFVLASDNAYLYRNVEQHLPVYTFTGADTPSNLRALERMVELAGAPECVIPGHDPEQFARFPTQGRVARIR